MKVAATITTPYITGEEFEIEVKANTSEGEILARPEVASIQITDTAGSVTYMEVVDE